MIIRSNGAARDGGQSGRKNEKSYFHLSAVGFTGSVTRTAKPLASESGGFMMTRSPAAMPSRISTVCPKSRPSFTARISTLFVGIDHADANALGAEQQRVGRQRERRRGDAVGEPHLRVAAGENFAARIVHLQFGQQRARVRAQSRRRCGRLWPRIFSRATGPKSVRRLSRRDGARHRLRHADINAQRIGLGQPEKFAAAAGGDELADIRLAAR